MHYGLSPLESEEENDSYIHLHHMVLLNDMKTMILNSYMFATWFVTTGLQGLWLHSCNRLITEVL